MKIDTLVNGWLNGSLSPEETAELAETLARDPAAADAFARATRLDSALRGHFRSAPAQAHFTKKHAAMARSRETAQAAVAAAQARWRARWRLTGAAAALAAGAWGVWAISARDTGSGGNSAQIGKSGPAAAQRGSRGEIAAVAGSGAAGDFSSRDSQDVRRALGRFRNATLTFLDTPITQALAAVEEEWKKHAHKLGQALTFRPSAALAKHWRENPAAEPRVSQPARGSTLRAALEVIAAAAGLEIAYTSAGPEFGPRPETRDREPKEWRRVVSMEELSKFAEFAAVRVNSFPITPNTPDLLWEEKLQVDDGLAETRSSHLPSLSGLREDGTEPSIPGSIDRPLVEGRNPITNGGLWSNGRRITPNPISGLPARDISSLDPAGLPTVEGIREFPFPSDFDPPQIPQTFGPTSLGLLGQPSLALFPDLRKESDDTAQTVTLVGLGENSDSQRRTDALLAALREATQATYQATLWRVEDAAPAEAQELSPAEAKAALARLPKGAQPLVSDWSAAGQDLTFGSQSEDAGLALAGPRHHGAQISYALLQDGGIPMVATGAIGQWMLLPGKNGAWLARVTGG
jgi:hypothetical protein